MVHFAAMATSQRGYAAHSQAIVMGKLLKEGREREGEREGASATNGQRYFYIYFSTKKICKYT